MATDSTAFYSSRLSLAFGVVTAVIAVGAVVAAVILVATGWSYAACLTVGIACCALGMLRGLWPGHPWYASRSRVTDVVVYLLLGAGVIFFAPWVFAIAA